MSVSKNYYCCCCISASLKLPLSSESKLLSNQNKGFFEYLDSGKHPQAIVCVIGRKIFPTKSERVCLGEIQNTPAVWSTLCSLPTITIIQKLLLFLVNFDCICVHKKVDFNLCVDVGFVLFFNVLRFWYNNVQCRDTRIAFSVRGEKVNEND